MSEVTATTTKVTVETATGPEKDAKPSTKTEIVIPAPKAAVEPVKPVEAGDPARKAADSKGLLDTILSGVSVRGAFGVNKLSFNAENALANIDGTAQDPLVTKGYTAGVEVRKTVYTAGPVDFNGGIEELL